VRSRLSTFLDRLEIQRLNPHDDREMVGAIGQDGDHVVLEPIRADDPVESP
jgi:hypothetical protein